MSSFEPSFSTITSTSLFRCANALSIARRTSSAPLYTGIITDTVGFIRHLPHKLVDAFRATLEETVEADLLLHVVDASSGERELQIAAVDEVLGEVGATAPVLLVYNKLDLLEAREPRIDRDDTGMPIAVWLSARDDLGMDLLRAAMAERLGPHRFEGWLRLGVEQARLRARFFDNGSVVEERMNEAGGSDVFLRLPHADLEQMLRREGIQLEQMQIVSDGLFPADGTNPV